MKKLLAIITLCLAVSLLFAACGSKNSDEFENEGVEDYEEEYEEEFEDFDDIEEEGGTCDESDLSWLTEIIEMTEEQASAIDGVYVKSGESYTACSPTDEGKNRQAFITDISLKYPGNSYVPTLDKSKDELVVFSDREIPIAKITKVEDCGFTIPVFGEYIEGSARSEDPILLFTATDHSIIFSPDYELFSEDGYEDEKYYGEDSDDIENQKELDKSGKLKGSLQSLECINDKDPMDIFKSGDVVKSNKVETLDEDRTDVIFKFEESEDVMIGYRDGTAYEEMDLKALARGFVAIEEEKEVDVKYGKNPYVTIDISDLESGTYLIDFENWIHYAVNIK